MRRNYRFVLSWIFLFLCALPVSAQIMIGRTASPPDLAGEWVLIGYEDQGAVGGLQPNPDDYLGVPFNEAGRMRSDTTAESILGMTEFQCRPHSAPHQWRGLGGARLLNELDPLDRSIRAVHLQLWRSLDRPIFLDGRAHPPAWAPHSWTGFSTGHWEGNTLVVNTTHLKDGFLKRGGPQTSDMLTMTEYLTRHDNLLTIVQVTDDPVYMDEPYVQSTTYIYDPSSRVNFETCNAGTFAESGGMNPHFVPHLLPDRELFINGWLPNEPWIPYDAIRGGVKTIYPEYRKVMAGEEEVEDLNVPSSDNEITADDKIQRQGLRDGEIHVMPIQGNISMIMADGRNIAASVGADGAILVNTGPANMTNDIQATLTDLINRTSQPGPLDCFGMNCPRTPTGWTSPYVNTVIASPAPVRNLRNIFNTSAAPHNTGGNAAIAASGYGREGRAEIISHENALLTMSGPNDDRWSAVSEAWPGESFYSNQFKLTAYFNGEAVVAYHEPNATTDGDIIVYFRHSEVIHAGDIYSSISYPPIYRERGGSVQGVIKGLNHILDLAVAEYRSQGGTWIIPGRGRLSDTADVAAYRNMVQIISDRIQVLIDEDLSLEQVIAARPTLDFDPRYGSDSGVFTTEMFVTAVYESLIE